VRVQELRRRGLERSGRRAPVSTWRRGVRRATRVPSYAARSATHNSK
jgi:hypothetical protein